MSDQPSSFSATHGPSSIPSAQLPHEMPVGSYVTGFIDLLGMSRRFLELEQSLLAEPYAEDQKNRAAQVFSAVHELRREVEQWYSTTDAPERIEQFLTRLPAESRPVFARARQHASKIQWFGDCVVISVPVHDDPPTVCQGLMTLVVGIAQFAFFQLAQGRPSRGGIEIGIGCELFPGEVVGASVAKAYRLERDAEAPRIVLGEDLLQVLANMRKESLPSPEKALVHAQLDLIDQFLIADDNRRIVDPCAVPLIRVIGSHAQPLANAIRVFVAQQLKLPMVTADSKLLSKYEWLDRVVVQRLPVD